MARLTLKDDGYPFKKICQGRKWIGRVWKNAEGKFVGKIDKCESKPQATEREAFEAVGALHFGHASAEDLHAHNSRVRHANSVSRARGRALADRLLGGDYSAIEELLK